ncbi:MAG: ATP-binding protein [Thermodesulfobacteriota bacterium]
MTSFEPAHQRRSDEGQVFDPPDRWGTPLMVKHAWNMLRRFTGSLRFKLSFYAGLVMFAAIVVFAYQSIKSQEESLINARVHSALKDSEVIRAAIWNGMMTKDREVIRQIIKEIGRQEGFREINIYDHKGALHYTTRMDIPQEVPGSVSEREEPLLKDIALNTGIRHRFGANGNVLTVVNPLVNTPGCSTAACHAHPESEQVLGALEVRLPIDDLRMRISALSGRTYLFACLLFLLISTLIGLGVIFLVSRPIQILEERAKRLALGEHVSSAPRTGFDSISVLDRAFDDMSRQIRARTAQLEQSRKRFKELFEMVPCYLTVIDRDLHIVRANKAFENEFGDLVGQPCFIGYKGRTERCEQCLVDMTFQDGLSHRAEQVWNPTGQNKTYVIVHTSPIFGDDGAVAEVLEMSIDVTRVVELQKQLENKDEQFHKLIEMVPCYLTVIDQDYRIAFYNRIFGNDFGDAWGKHCFRVYKNRDTKCENCPVEKTFSDNRPHTSEEVWLRNSGEVYVIIHTSPVTDEQGRTVAVMEMCTDVTELKLLQNELAVLGETIAGMSHSVKNILSGLEGGVYVVDSGLQSGRDERVRMGWNMVKKNVEKVSELVKDILFASKERQPEYRECEPSEILTEVCRLYEGKARTCHVHLARDFDVPIGTCMVDPKGVHSALSNLVSNAIEACRTGSPTAGHTVVLGGRIEHDDLVLRVTDDGIGMPDEVRQNLFRKFYSTKGSKGTGLGLVVTKKVIDEHGGSIQVESEPGKGTTFLVRLPMVPPQPRNVDVTRDSPGVPIELDTLS